MVHIYPPPCSRWCLCSILCTRLPANRFVLRAPKGGEARALSPVLCNDSNYIKEIRLGYGGLYVLPQWSNAVFQLIWTCRQFMPLLIYCSGGCAMSRFVIVSFAFLGWGFYEISGGADFVAPERPPEQLAEVSTTSAPLATTSPVTNKFQRSAKIRAASLVPAPVLQPATTAQPAAGSRPGADPAHRQTVALDKIAAAGANLQSSSSAFAPSAETGLLHMDHIQGGLIAMSNRQDIQGGTGGLALNTGLAGAEPAQPVAPAESYLDIREIRASRVNMRQGPGTIYPVTARLLAGDEVLIVEDNGTGWLQLRTRIGNKIGWVAASLVSKKRS